MKHDTERNGPLAGLKVIDCATVFAGPLSAMVFADFGADVIKIEHPNGDALRGMGKSKDGHGLASLQATARERRNVFASLMEAMKTHSLGQISHALYDVGCEYRRNM